MKQLNCPLCDEDVFSDVGVGCKMCGMPLNEQDIDFCSRECETKYKNIHNIQI